MKRNLPEPPEHLRPETRAWWERLVAEFEFEPHHLMMLQAACEAWDRAAEARELLARDGLVVSTASGGTKTHPAAQIEQNSRLAFLRAVRELDLDAEPAPQAKRPPRLYSNRG